MGNDTVLGIVGSPNRDGRTYKLVAAALEGAARTGAQTEIVQMADHKVSACKDCMPWVCQTNLRCTYDDPAFEYLSEKILNCGAFVFGTPVYWGDNSGIVRYFYLKMCRVYARTSPLRGLPALGIAIAGGTGNGLVSGLRQVYGFFHVLAMRGLEPFPATRFNFDSALESYGKLGAQLAGLAHERQYFADPAERTLWYDTLPYLSLDRAGERRLLAGIVHDALPGGADPEIISALANSDLLRTEGRHIEAIREITRAYESGVKAFTDQTEPSRV